MFRWEPVLHPIVVSTLCSDNFYGGGPVDLGTARIRKNKPLIGSIFVFKKLLQPINRALEAFFHWPLSDGVALRDLTNWIILGMPKVNLNVFSSLQIGLNF